MDLDERIRSYLDGFADDLWIKRQLELQEIVENVERLCRAGNNTGDSVSSSWLHFIRFIEAECSGRHFSSDKQWSELMNLMQISRRFNHRSVKLKDIIKNKQLIEANERAICRLNESARLIQTIESSLDQLESLLNNKCTLVLHLDGEAKSQQQLDELLVAKRFLSERLSTLYTLQLELEGLSGDSTSMGVHPQVQSQRARVERLQLVTSKLDEILSNLWSLFHHLSQLDPLINVEREAKLDSDAKSGLDQLESSVGLCKRLFAEVQEFTDKKLMPALSDAGTTNRKKTHLKLNLVKLINSSSHLIIKGDLLVGSLREALTKLEQCRATLSSVMQNLRLEFGRFYFVSDLELLTIIALDARLITGESSQQTQRLLGKLFNNSIGGFVLDGQKQSVLGVRSPHDEVILFSPEEVGVVPIKKSTNLYSVEIVRILNDVLRKLRKSLQLELAKSFTTQKDSIDWTLPVQLMNLAEQIKFCQRVEKNLGDSSGTQELLSFYQDRFRELSGELQATGSGPESEFKLSAAISMTVHFMSTLNSLAGAKGKNDWHWLKRVRYYLNPNGVEVRIADTRFEYKFDYLPPQTNEGLSKGPQAATFKRLISTQITERCLLAASQSVANFRLGSSPFGPAGSGKTETVKALGVALGCHVIVHNCDESNDGQSLEQLIWGLAHTGLWGCLDEFNRLGQSALSSISSVLELVQASIRSSKRVVELGDGRIMPIDESAAFFVTMNPASLGKGYLGRRQLPANLRQLFLPVAMTRVQMDAIVSESLLALDAELKGRFRLQSEQAKALGDIIVKVTDQLSRNFPQTFTCTWDLRLIMATLKRVKLHATSVKSSTKDVPESDISALKNLLRLSLEHEIVPRLSEAELNTFRPVLAQHIPVSVSEHLDKSRSQTLSETLSKMIPKLRADPARIIERAAQLEHLLETRAGVILLGPSGSGKSTTWRLLQLALNDCVKCLPVNPRASPREMLFGQVNPLTRKWEDGLVTSRVRQALNMLLGVADGQKSPNQVWLILDGPIDPDWIESFNSVLDDNQVLTLGSGERLNFAPSLNKSIKLIIESDSIEFASPATISRLGVVLHPAPGEKDSTHFKPQLSITEPPNAWRSRLKEVQDFLGGSARPLIISGSTQSVRFELVRELIDFEQTKVVELCCSALSDCRQLLELVSENSGADYFILINVHLIKHEDQWGVKSFLELLRFILTYGGFYDQEMVFRKIEAHFILTLDSVDSIDQRTLSQALVIELEISTELGHNNKDVQELPLAQFDIGQVLDSKHSSPILSVSSDQDEIAKIRQYILNRSDDYTMMTFKTLKSITRSVEALEELLNKCQRRGPPRKNILFLLSDLECELMSHRMRSKLFYLLSGLRKVQNLTKFVFLARDLDKVDNLEVATFWASLGPVIHLKSIAKPFQARYDLHRSIENELSDLESKWLIEKTTKLAENLTNTDRCQVDIFVMSAIKLLKNSRSELENQSRSLSEGLNGLWEFEREMERIKSKCQQKEVETNLKKEEISHLMTAIDKALKDAKIQQTELMKLKQEQSKKQREISEQREQVNAQLVEVSRLVEASKSEVAKHLKSEALNEIKALRSPPTTIKDILDALFVLLRLEDCSWPSMRAHLTRYSLKDELTNYDFRRNLNETLLNKVSALMRTKRESFNAQQAARASKAVVPILGWIEAALEYGQVLVKLEPLSEQVKGLESEAASLEEQAKELEREVNEVEARIEADSARLAKLQKDHEASLREASGIRAQLERAQLVRQNLEGQTGRWRKRLTFMGDWLKGTELAALCSLVVTAILFDDQRGDSQGALESWMELFEVRASSRVELCAQLIELLLPAEGGLFRSSGGKNQPQPLVKAEEADKVLQLICMRHSLSLQAAGCHLRPLLVELQAGGAGGGSSLEEVARHLAFRPAGSSAALLCQQLAEVAIVRCDRLSGEDEWRQSIELALRLNKLVLVELPSDDVSLDLDIMDYVFTKSLSAGDRAVDGNNNNNNNNNNAGRHRLVLAANLDQHSAIRGLVRPVRLLAGCSSRAELEPRLMDHLLAWAEPELSARNAELSLELQRKQQETCRQELQLLRRLAARNGGTGQAGLEELIKTLGELHQLSESLELASGQLEASSAELERRKEKYWPHVKEAAHFYADHLAPLGQQSSLGGFYSMLLKTYLRLLIDSNKRQLSEGPTARLDFGRIVRCALRPLPSQVRAQFELGLRNGARRWVPEEAQAVEMSVSGAIEELLHAISDEPQVKPALMVVLHEPTKSSPLLEIDELFRRRDEEQHSAKCLYGKFYATSDSYEKLEGALGAALSHRELSSRGGAGRNPEKPGTIVVLCVANAHLAAKWLNSRLVQVISKAASPSTPAKPATRTLIILIGESCAASSGRRTQDTDFDSNLLDFSQVKCWHDDSMLKLIDRFNLFLRSMTFKQVVGGSHVDGNSSELLELAQQTVLFHVVCQEGAKGFPPRAAGRWRNSYSFDYDQLCLALKSLARLSSGANHHPLRELYYHYLRDFVYGARMESAEDELTLGGLIERFLGSRESGREQMNRAATLSTTTDQYEQQLSGLVLGD